MVDLIVKMMPRGGTHTLQRPNFLLGETIDLHSGVERVIQPNQNVTTVPNSSRPSA
jgi:hypothetical protein